MWFGVANSCSNHHEHIRSSSQSKAKVKCLLCNSWRSRRWMDGKEEGSLACRFCAKLSNSIVACFKGTENTEHVKVSS